MNQMSEHSPSKLQTKSTITSSHSQDMIHSLLQCILIQFQPYQTAKKHFIQSLFPFSFYFPLFVLPPMSSLPTPNSILNNIDITERDVHEALCTLDLSKAPEPDGISQKNPTILFDYYLRANSLPLYTQCLAEHTIPSEW